MIRATFSVFQIFLDGPDNVFEIWKMLVLYFTQTGRLILMTEDKKIKKLYLQLGLWTLDNNFLELKSIHDYSFVIRWQSLFDESKHTKHSFWTVPISSSEDIFQLLPSSTSYILIRKYKLKDVNRENYADTDSGDH